MDVPALAKKYAPVIGLLTGGATLIGIVWTLASFVFSLPTLSITVQTTPLRIPYYMYQRLDRTLMRDSLILSDSSLSALRTVRGFLRDVSSFVAVTLTNNSEVSLSRVDLRVRFAHDLDGWAISGETFDVQERRSLLDSIRYDAANSLVTLRSIPRMPPKSTITLYLWGDIAYAASLASSQVSASYDGGAGEVIAERTVRGADAFVYDNSGLLVMTLLLLNVSAWGWYVDHQQRRAVSVKPEATG